MAGRSGDCPVCGESVPVDRLNAHVLQCLDGGPPRRNSKSNFSRFHEWSLACCDKVMFTLKKTGVACPEHKQIPLDAPTTTHELPWKSTATVVRSICIRPTSTQWNLYNSQSLLHCGVADSKGNVYNFDERGCRSEGAWAEAVCIPVEHKALTDAQFDRALEEHLKHEQQLEKGTRYHPLDNNCYSFVVRFLNKIAYGGSDKHTKVSLVNGIIERPVKVADTFISVYRQLGSKPFVVVDRPLTQTSRWSCDFCRKALYAPDHWHCEDCADTDLCISCYNKKCQNAEHKNTHRMTQRLPEESKAGGRERKSSASSASGSGSGATAAGAGAGAGAAASTGSAAVGAGAGASAASAAASAGTASAVSGSKQEP